MKLKFKIILISSFLICFSITAFSQKKIEADTRIAEVYGQAKVEAMLASAPQKILHFNYFLNNSFYVSKSLPANTVVKGDIYSVPSRNNDYVFNESEELVRQGKFNRLKYSFRLESNNYTAYEMGSSGIFVIFYPEEVYFERERAYMRTFGIKL